MSDYTDEDVQAATYATADCTMFTEPGQYDSETGDPLWVCDVHTSAEPTTSDEHCPNAEHLTRLALDAVVPAIVRRAKAEALRDLAYAIEEMPWEVGSTEGPLPDADDRTWMHGADCGVRFAARLTRMSAELIERGQS